MWYCAHGIFYFEYKYEKQDSYLVYESVYIINAADEESALNESIRIAKENSAISSGGWALIRQSLR